MIETKEIIQLLMCIVCIFKGAIVLLVRTLYRTYSVIRVFKSIVEL